MKTLKKPHKWSRKYKLSINCKHPKGFSQKQYCKYGRRSRNSPVENRTIIGYRRGKNTSF